MLIEPALPSSVDRPALRRRLLAERAAFGASEAAAAAHLQLARQLVDVLAELAPQTLGLYSPVRSEFNALAACLADHRLAAMPIALPFCFRNPRRMDYRQWDRRSPLVADECKIASASGAVVVPDVLVVPCVGFTPAGHRLGYGGGYFDRYLAAHPHLTTVGVALAAAEIAEADLAPQPHDMALTLVVTERGVA